MCGSQRRIDRENRQESNGRVPFISKLAYGFGDVGNKVGMAIGTALLAGVLWILTAVVLWFYQINKTSYNRIVAELAERKQVEL